MTSKSTKEIKREALALVFKDKAFTEAIAFAVSGNIVAAIRDIDSWDFKYEIKNLLSETIFTEDFKEELKESVSKMVKDQKEEIKELVKENINSIVVNGVISASEKIGALLVKKISDVSSVY